MDGRGMMLMLFVLVAGERGRGQRADLLIEQASHAKGTERVRLLEQGVAADPTSAKVHYLLGKALAETKEYSRALTEFQETESRTPDPSFQAVTLFQEARMSVALGDVPKAKALAERSQERFATPENEALLRELGVGEKIVPADTIASSLASSSTRSLVLETESGATGHAINLPIEFQFQQERMTASGRRQAEELAKALSSASLNGARFRVIGHTDSRGSVDYNQALSERRARAVVSFLATSYGLDSSRFRTEGRGSREPLARGESEESYQLNRRVEIQAILP